MSTTAIRRAQTHSRRQRERDELNQEVEMALDFEDASSNQTSGYEKKPAPEVMAFYEHGGDTIVTKIEVPENIRELVAA